MSESKEVQKQVLITVSESVYRQAEADPKFKAFLLEHEYLHSIALANWKKSQNK